MKRNEQFASIPALVHNYRTSDSLGCCLLHPCPSAPPPAGPDSNSTTTPGKENNTLTRRPSDKEAGTLARYEIDASQVSIAQQIGGGQFSTVSYAVLADSRCVCTTCWSLPVVCGCTDVGVVTMCRFLFICEYQAFHIVRTRLRVKNESWIGIASFYDL